MRRVLRLACAPLAAGLTALALPLVGSAGTLDAHLAAQVARTKQLGPRPIPIIVELDGRPDVAALELAVAGLPESARPGALAQQLRQGFERQAPAARELLERAGATEIEPLWISHAMAAVAAPNVIERIAQTPGVARVYSDVALKAPNTRLPTTAEALRARRPRERPKRPAETPTRPTQAASFDATGWRGALPTHLSAIGVSEWWQRGVAGRDVVVAIVDSGVDGRDPVLKATFRGGQRDGSIPFAQRKAPYDGSNHGSHVARLIAGGPGDDASEPPLGVAPQARWIAARIYDDAGIGKLSAIHRIHQWLLDPDGRPETADAPRIVNNSWALPQTAGRCERELEHDFAGAARRAHPRAVRGRRQGRTGHERQPVEQRRRAAVGALGPDGGRAGIEPRPVGLRRRATPQPLAPGSHRQSEDAAARILGATDLVSGTSRGGAARAAGAGPDRQRRSIGELRRAREAAGRDALARGLERGPAPVELAGTPSRAADGSVAVDAAALRAVLPWNARLSRVSLDPASAGASMAADGSRVVTGGGAATGSSSFTLLAAADDGRTWRVAVTPQAAQNAPQTAARRLSLTVASGGTAVLTTAQLAAALAAEGARVADRAGVAVNARSAGRRAPRRRRPVHRPQGLSRRRPVRVRRGGRQRRAGARFRVRLRELRRHADHPVPQSPGWQGSRSLSRAARWRSEALHTTAPILPRRPGFRRRRAPPVSVRRPTPSR